MSMTIAQTDEPKQRPLRLWPGVVAAVLLLLVRFVAPIAVPGNMMFWVLGGLVGALAVGVWWLFFSRAPWVERVGAIVLMIAAAFATSRLIHKSIAGGMMGMMFPIYAIPILSLARLPVRVGGECLLGRPGDLVGVRDLLAVEQPIHGEAVR